MVLSLSWLNLGKPEVAPPAMCAGCPLNFKQTQVVTRFEKLSSELVVIGDVGPRAMGRTAAKVESLAFILQELQEFTRNLVPGYKHQAPAQKRQTSETSEAGHDCGDPGTVIGRLKHGAPVVAKCVEPSRLSFPAEAPKFDPSDLLEEPRKTVYQDPLSRAVS